MYIPLPYKVQKGFLDILTSKCSIVSSMAIIKQLFKQIKIYKVPNKGAQSKKEKDKKFNFPHQNLIYVKIKREYINILQLYYVLYNIFVIRDTPEKVKQAKRFLTKKNKEKRKKKKKIYKKWEGKTKKKKKKKKKKTDRKSTRLNSSHFYFFFFIFFRSLTLCYFLIVFVSRYIHQCFFEFNFKLNVRGNAFFKINCFCFLKQPASVVEFVGICSFLFDVLLAPSKLNLICVCDLFG
eukprot:TRINITY_DN1852_c1_g1_i9.p1 TRINITY_DN1852_c1_g1~~TRINITY_DN1852_c1_g1_i9.p1  ORF type:complete len:237 (-),score=4.23 TRINITY_DN1852_c1_g1_i9:110-820(-)